MTTPTIPVHNVRITKKGLPDKRCSESKVKKLLPEDFSYIRSEVASGRSQYSLSKQFDVSRQLISLIVKGERGQRHFHLSAHLTQNSTQNSTQNHPEEK